MGFEKPKPRNIEKDVKVFQWALLDQALKRLLENILQISVDIH